MSIRNSKAGDEMELGSSRDFVIAHGFDSKIVKKKKTKMAKKRGMKVNFKSDSPLSTANVSFSRIFQRI